MTTARGFNIKVLDFDLLKYSLVTFELWTFVYVILVDFFNLDRKRVKTFVLWSIFGFAGCLWLSIIFSHCMWYQPLWGPTTALGFTMWYKSLGNQRKWPIGTFCVVIFIAVVQGLQFLIKKHTLRVFRIFLLPDLGRDRHALPDIG